MERTESRRRSAAALKLGMGAFVVGVAAFFGLRSLTENWACESTDDAFIDAHIVSIAPQVAGEALDVHVVENQQVKAGDPLVDIDPRVFAARVNQKRAAVESARANQHALEAGFDLMRARVITADATRKQSESEGEASKSTYENAQANWERAQTMWTNSTHRAISAQDFDAARAAMVTAKANWQAALDKVASDASKVIEARVQLSTTQKLYEQAGAQVSQAQADLQAAELELSYTKIVAPVAGRVTRKMVEKGSYLQVGQALLAIVRPEVWVTANFKETQTAKIHPAQPVRITVDGMGDRVFRGHVESLQSGSGARFSLLPPENAVGNYVKVVQRVPVKIAFDDPVQAAEGLGPGMSASPAVQIGPQPLSDLVIGLLSLGLAAGTAGLMWGLVMRRSEA
jgi:membrane fusion protein (multidrug efflux system)